MKIETGQLFISIVNIGSYSVPSASASGRIDSDRSRSRRKSRSSSGRFDKMWSSSSCNSASGSGEMSDPGSYEYFW